MCPDGTGLNRPQSQCPAVPNRSAMRLLEAGLGANRFDGVKCIIYRNHSIPSRASVELASVGFNTQGISGPAGSAQKPSIEVLRYAP